MEYALICESRSGHNFVKLNINSWFPSCKYHNIESFMIDEYYNNGKYYSNNQKNPQNIILIRNPLNWLASFIRQLETDNKKTQADINRMVAERTRKYIDIAEEGFGVTNKLPNKHVIIYDEFVTERSVREYLCNRLGGKYNEKEINTVPFNGRYSSFDGQKFKNKGSEMKVLDRYLYYEGKNTENAKLYFKTLKENPRMIELYMSNFTDSNIDFMKRHGII